MKVTNATFKGKIAACCNKLYTIVAAATVFIGNKKWVAGIGLLFLLVNGEVNTHAQGVPFDWVRTYGNQTIPSSTNTNVANDRRVAIDGWGNVYVASTFSRETDFNLLYSPVLLTPKGSNDVFITKHNIAGELIWAKQYFGTTEGGYAACEGIISDHSGNIYITGQFTGTIKFHIGQSQDSLTSTYGSRSYTRDIFIAKLDSAGNCIWVKGFGGKAEDYAYSLEGDNKGNVYLTGVFQDTVDFDPGAGIAQLVSSKNAAQTAFVNNTFITKFDSNGNHIWANYLYGSRGAQSNANSIAVDKSGNAYIISRFNDTLFFETGSGREYIVSSVGTIFFIAKIDSSGVFQWAKGAGTGGARFAHGIGVDDGGNVYYAGRFQGLADFSTDTTSLLISSNGMEDVFVSKLNSSGDFLWVKTFGSGGGDGAFSLDVDRVGNVYITGGFNGTVDFDPGPDSFNLVATRNVTTTDLHDDVFILKLHGNGDFAWAKAINGSNGTNEIGRNIRLDRSGNVYVAGSVRPLSGDRVDFNPGTLDADTFFVTQSEVFLLKLICTDTNSFLLDIVECAESYTYNGETYTASGQYIHKFPNAAGCDSIVTLNLALYQIEEPFINVNEFELGVTGTYATYQWMKDGVLIPGATGSTLTVTENGDYQVIVTNENGCTDTSAIYKVDNVGIEDIMFQNALQLYPNPTSGHITFTSARSLQNSTIRFVNLVGQTVKIYRDQQGSRFSFDISTYADGVYFMEVTEGGKTARMKIVKVR